MRRRWPARFYHFRAGTTRAAHVACESLSTHRPATSNTLPLAVFRYYHFPHLFVCVRIYTCLAGFPIANDPIYASSELTSIKQAQGQAHHPASSQLQLKSVFVGDAQPFRQRCDECCCEVVQFDTQNFELWLHACAMSGEQTGTSTGGGGAFRFEVPPPAWAAHPPKIPLTTEHTLELKEM